MRRALAALALLLATPATASAAPFGELPFQPVTSAAVCLAPTGVPGGLVRWTPAGAELLEATPGGLVAQATIGLGTLERCPVAALDPSGAGVAAGATDRSLRIAVRDPGGGWGAPATLPVTRAYVTAAAVSARGDAVVAWVVYEENFRKAHVEVARRAPGGAFGAPQVMPGSSDDQNAQVALSAAGEAVLVLSDAKAVRVATAAPGAVFGPPRKLLGRDVFSADPELAINPDGRVLLAVGSDDGTSLFDREPGGDFVRRPEIGTDDDLAIAMGADGTAIVAWESAGAVAAMRREGTGPFGAPIAIQDEQPRRPTEASFGAYSSDGPPIEFGRLRVALGADGRALLTWPGIETGLQAASLTPDGRAEVVSLGSPVRPATGMSPLLLADGTRAVAWTDQNELLSFPPYAGRLHFAVESAAEAPVPATPEVTVGTPRDRSLRPIQPLVLPVRCSAACDVRAFVVGHSGAVSVALSRAGKSELAFESGIGALAPKRGPLNVTVSWSAPGAHTASSRTIAVRVRRLPAPPLPRLLDVRARRAAGGVVDVRWRTDGPAQDAYFSVVGTTGPSVETDRAPKIKVLRGGTRRRSFHVRLRDAKDVRYVTVDVAQLLGRERRVRVRVRVQ